MSSALLHSSLPLGLLIGTLRLALQLRSFALRLSSKLVRLAGSLARNLVGFALRLSGAEASGLLGLLRHLAGLVEALDGGSGDVLISLVNGLRVEIVSYVDEGYMEEQPRALRTSLAESTTDLRRGCAVEKKRVLVVRAVREAVAATRYMVAVVIVVFV